MYSYKAIFIVSTREIDNEQIFKREYGDIERDYSSGEHGHCDGVL